MQLRFLLFSVCFLFSSITFAQSEAIIDSLKQGVEANKGLDKIPFLDELAWSLIRSKPEEAVAFAKQALEIAGTSGDSIVVSKSANTLGACLIQTGDYDQAMIANRRALNIRKTSGSPRDIGSSLSKIGLIYQNQSLLDSAIPYQIDALHYFEEATDSGAIAQTYTNLASLFDNNKDTNKALEYAEKAKIICEQINYDYGLGGALGNISMLWETKERF